MIPGKNASSPTPRNPQSIAVMAIVASKSWVIGRKRKRLAIGQTGG